MELVSPSASLIQTALIHKYKIGLVYVCQNDQRQFEYHYTLLSWPLVVCCMFKTSSTDDPFSWNKMSKNIDAFCHTCLLESIRVKNKVYNRTHILLYPSDWYPGLHDPTESLLKIESLKRRAPELEELTKQHEENQKKENQKKEELALLRAKEEENHRQEIEKKKREEAQIKMAEMLKFLQQSPDAVQTLPTQVLDTLLSVSATNMEHFYSPKP